MSEFAEIPGLSADAVQLLKSLSKKEIEEIQRDNPFRIDRNKAIYALKKRGIQQKVLVEVTGLAIQTIKKICIVGRRQEKNKEAPVIGELRAMRGLMETGVKELQKITKTISQDTQN